MQDDAVEDPSDNIPDGVGETGVDVGNVDIVEDEPVGWEEEEVHGRAEIGRDKAVRVASEESGKDGCCWGDEQGGDGDGERDGEG